MNADLLVVCLFGVILFPGRAVMRSQLYPVNSQVAGQGGQWQPGPVARGRGSVFLAMSLQCGGLDRPKFLVWFT